MQARVRRKGWVARRTVAMAVATFVALFAVQAFAAAPEVAEISEPALSGAPLNPEDVHMVAVFADGAGDDDGHLCSTWEIRTLESAETVWQAPCVGGLERVHIHLGDGEFLGSHAGRTSLMHDTEYELRVRFRDDSGDEAEEWSDWQERLFSTRSAGPQGNEAVAWTARTGYVVDTFAEGLQLPVNIAMVPNPGPHPGDPLMYVAELYGIVKVITRDGTVKDYATDLLNFNPTGNFPGSGEMGVTGIVVEPASGDVFVSLVYEDVDSPEEPKPHYPMVVRLQSDERGLLAIGQATVLDMAGEIQGASHQISNLTIGPDGHLYVHNGDGFDPSTARNLDSFRGKVLRMTLAGDPVSDNPFYDSRDGIAARDYVFASGFRNPFGGAWRLSDGSHYTVENGQVVDRLAKVIKGEDYLWEGGDGAMTHLASYNWLPAHAPVNIEFVESGRFGGSTLPAVSMGHAFVTESGSTWASGPQETGKRIVEFDLDSAGNRTGGPYTLVEYTGIGKATASGLAAGPGGLYFTDLYKDTDFASPIDRGANVLRVRCTGECPLPGDADVTQVDSSSPIILFFKMQRRAFAKGKPGTAFIYSLSAPASVRIAISRVRRGWRSDGRCRLPSERAMRKARRRSLPRCVLRRPQGSLAAPGLQGTNRRKFYGWLDNRWLPPGRYLAKIRATDVSGDTARRSIDFRITHR